jgi:uncharacterized protein (DUF58 family)
MTAPLLPANGARRLQLHVGRRLDGLLHGDHVGYLLGPGSEPAESRPYTVGDDVRRIDWPATARTSDTVVRDAVAERELRATLVLDLSASMSFGTVRCEKRDLALEVAAAFGHLVRGPGDRIGAVLLTADGMRRLPARSGTAGTLAVLRAADGIERADVAAPPLERALTALGRQPSRRGLVVVISDLIGSTQWQAPLRVLTRRHDVIVVEVIDPRELELPAVGALRLVDPETGRQLEVHTTPGLRQRFARAAAARRRDNADAVRGAGADHLVLRTDRDWLPELARHLSARRRHRSIGARTLRGAA